MLFPSFFKRPDDILSANVGLSIETLTNFSSLEIGTQLHGGFGSMSLDVKGSRDDSIRRYRDYLGSHVAILDWWGRRIYEGRVQDTNLMGMDLSVKADGYYACGREEIMGYVYTTTTTVTQCIKDCVGAVEGSSDLNIWQEKWAFVVNDANIDITALGPKDYTTTKVGEVIEEVCKLGYKTTDCRPLYFALWSNRIPGLFAEPEVFNTDAARINRGQFWLLTSYNLVDSEIYRSRSTVFNKVYGLYDGPAGPTLTAPVENWISRWRYGQRTGVISVGQIPQAVAEGLRDYAVERYAYPRQMYRFGVKGLIVNASGMHDYPYRIRAGDLVSIVTFDPLVTHLDRVYGEAVAGISGMVISTSYSMTENVNRIEITTNDTRLDMLLTRLGIGGSLS